MFCLPRLLLSSECEHNTVTYWWTEMQLPVVLGHQLIRHQSIRELFWRVSSNVAPLRLRTAWHAQQAVVQTHSPACRRWPIVGKHSSCVLRTLYHCLAPDKDLFCSTSFSFEAALPFLWTHNSYSEWRNRFLLALTYVRLVASARPIDTSAAAPQPCCWSQNK